MTVQSNLEISKLNKVAEILKAVAHPIRIQVIDLLNKHERLTVTQIYQSLNVEQSLASHHLSKMRDKGVLTAVRDGKNIYYELTDDKITDIIECIENCNIL